MILSKIFCQKNNRHLLTKYQYKQYGLFVYDSAFPAYNRQISFLLEFTMKTKGSADNKQLKARIIRAVASSTAIETGQSIKVLEASLKSKSSKFQHLTLAN